MMELVDMPGLGSGDLTHLWGFKLMRFLYLPLIKRTLSKHKLKKDQPMPKHKLIQAYIIGEVQQRQMKI